MRTQNAMFSQFLLHYRPCSLSASDLWAGTLMTFHSVSSFSASCLARLVQYRALTSLASWVQSVHGHKGVLVVRSLESGQLAVTLVTSLASNLPHLSSRGTIRNGHASCLSLHAFTLALPFSSSSSLWLSRERWVSICKMITSALQ